MRNYLPVGFAKCLTKLAALCAFFIATSLSAFAGPIGVSYTVSGSAGDWTLDFSFTNNSVAGQALYFMGVSLPAQDFGSIPSGFTPCGSGSCVSGTYGGYDNVWLDTTYPAIAGIAPGSSLSGFDVIVTAATAPTSVDWFAYTDNPSVGYIGYTGVAGSTTTSTTPEPGSLLLSWYRPARPRPIHPPRSGALLSPESSGTGIRRAGLQTRPLYLRSRRSPTSTFFLSPRKLIRAPGEAC